MNRIISAHPGKSKRRRRGGRANPGRTRRRKARGGGCQHAGPPGTLLRKVLRPLKTAIGRSISQEKEKSWFPVLSMLAQVVCGLFYHLFGLSSMRSAVEKTNHSKDLGIPRVCLSTFSDAMNSPRRLKVLRQVFQNLLLEFSDRLPPQLHKFRHLAAIDSTIIECVLSAVWADFRKTVKACKTHLVFDLAKSVPKDFIVSAARIHDRMFLDAFLERGWTYILDRAYNVYWLFDRMTHIGIFFVTRLKSNAQYEVIMRNHVKRKHRKMGVISDEIIRLGTGVNTMIYALRLVTFQAEDGRIFHFLTNRFDLVPTSVAALYRARWAIELFFKFLKRTLRGSRLLARSELGAEAHVLIALMADILTKCLAKAIGAWHKVKRHVPVTFLRAVRDFLLEAWSLRLQTILAEALEGP